MKKILYALLASASTILANWSGLTIEPEETKVIDGKNFYLITAPHELAWFAEQVNSGNTDINGILTDDIVLGQDENYVSQTLWTPIGNDSTHIYQGIFDGDGHTISGLYFSTFDENYSYVPQKYSGLFGVTGKNAIIKNLNIKSFNLNTSYSQAPSYLGIFAAINGGRIENSSLLSHGHYKFINSIYNSPSQEWNVILANYFGGITALNYGEIHKVSVADSLIFGECNGSSNKHGGIAGINLGTISNSSVNVSIRRGSTGSRGYIGGITGDNQGLISNTTFSGRILCYSLGFGGIAAINSGIIENDTNTAHLTNMSYKTTSGDFGGIVGRNTGVVKYCLNTGNIIDTIETGNGKITTGGIAGFNSDSVLYCTNKGAVLGYFVEDKSQNPDRENYTGGIVGENNGFIKVTENNGNVAYGSKIGGITAYNSGRVYDVKNTVSLTYGLFNVNAGIFNRAYSTGTTGKTGNIYPYRSTCSNCYASKIQVTQCKPGFTDILNCEKETIWMDRTEFYHNAYKFAWELNTADSIPNTGIWSCESENSHPRFANEIYHPTYKLTFDSEGNTYSDANGHPLNIPKAREYSTKYFIGWFKDGETDKLTSNSIITADSKYYPKYVSANEVTWHIEFLNEDGTSLYKQDVHHQEQPVYGGAIPTKQGNVKYSYTFAGWSPTIYAANKDQTYTATFNTSINQYQIEFKDFDESSLATLPFEYGKMPSLTTTPKRDSTEEWIYTFSRWTPDIASVTGPAIYTAVYDSIKVKYKVIFLNGAEEYEVQMVEYGSDAILPQAPQSSKAGYVFTGWKGDYTNITKSTILRAQFEEKVEVSSSSKEVPSSSSQTHVVSSSSEQIQPSSSAEENRSSSSVSLSSSSKEVSSSSIALSSSSTEIQSSSAVESSSSVASSSSRETVSSSSTEAPSSSSELESSSSAIQSSCSSAEVSSSSVKASSSSVSLSSSSKEVSSSSIALSSSSSEIQSSSAVESCSSVTQSSSSEKVSSSSIEPSSSSETVSSSSVEVSSSSVKESSSSTVQSSSSAEATSSSSVTESSSSEENTPLITGISKTFTVSVVDHRILITNARIGSTFALFDMQGRTLSQGKINSGSHLIEMPKKGKYIIWAEGKAVTATIK